jgi:NAD(P)-dependent dehydrogenase (short-subunit alcohol dehydrogenase family)
VTVALISGGGTGIGRATARELARAGTSVTICGRRPEPLEAVRAELEAAGTECLAVPADIREPEQVDFVVDQTLERFGRIDILVNNAAIFSSIKLKPFEQIEVAEWRKVMDVNILGVALCCRACVPHMRKAGGGRIINLASGAPIKGVPMFLHYISSKGAVIAMTRGLARELGKDGITVNTLAPGFTLSENVAKDPTHVKQGEVTRMTRAIQRDETPEDLVGTVSFLASADAAFMTGQTLVVDGGSAML